MINELGHSFLVPAHFLNERGFGERTANDSRAITWHLLAAAATPYKRKRECGGPSTTGGVCVCFVCICVRCGEEGPLSPPRLTRARVYDCARWLARTSDRWRGGSAQSGRYERVPNSPDASLLCSVRP